MSESQARRTAVRLPAGCSAGSGPAGQPDGEPPGPRQHEPARGGQPGRSPAPAPRPAAGGTNGGSAEVVLEYPVVAGFDGSSSSRHALAYAAGMARRLGRPLLIVYVCAPPMYCEPLTGQVAGAVRDRAELERWLLAELSQITDITDIPVAVLTRSGSPARELAAAAAEQGADALVIGAPRRSWHHLAGSVPGWLARHAQCPVVVVP